ncbi:hypothetical protein MWH25_06275 [Natroniella acetigena]|uniref:OadG family protein n=1 Tax=Natroniella acetigena TaxID=52004 RepID=UPI00200A21C6|nr:hypothetical protein [Natroniella acetigena]MCK8827348.1 hypothetical protein [Natroniella acetigena]
MERFGLGLQISLTGVLIVSLALASIPLLVKIIEFVVVKLGLNGRAATKQVKKLENDQTCSNHELTEGELVAICAAIHTYLSDEEQEYEIRSITEI